jgi:hypothetical protein
VDGVWSISRPAHVAQTVFGTLDAHGRELGCGSEAPADPAVTRRKLTNIVASEHFGKHLIHVMRLLRLEQITHIWLEGTRRFP